MVEGLLHPVAQPGKVGDDLAPVPALVAQGHEQARRHVAGTRQAELADARQPQAVGDVGRAALDLLDMLGMHQRGPHAGRLDGSQGRVPIHAGGLHHGRGHAVSADSRAPVSLRFGDEPANRECDHGPLPPAGHCTTLGPCSAGAAARPLGVFHAFGVCASS